MTPEEKKAYNAKYQRENRKRYPERYRKYKETERLILKGKVDALLGVICKKCGFDDIRALNIDHVFNDGAIERRTRNNGIREGGSRHSLYREVIRSHERYQRLCCNCDRIKAVESGTSCKKQPGIDRPEESFTQDFADIYAGVWENYVSE